jgi:MinD-like ATPase involved in chromosome partitioning or flagellar assembly
MGTRDPQVTLYSSDDRPLRAPATRQQQDVVGRAANGRHPVALPGMAEGEGGPAAVEDEALPARAMAPSAAPSPPAAPAAPPPVASVIQEPPPPPVRSVVHEPPPPPIRSVVQEPPPPPVRSVVHEPPPPAVRSAIEEPPPPPVVPPPPFQPPELAVRVDAGGTVDAFAARSTVRSVVAAPPPEAPQPPRAAVDFAAENFLKPAAMPPAAGWRRVVWQATGHHYIPPLSRSEQRRQAVTLRARASVSTPTVIASAAGKGGVGKTTVALGASVAAALVRADRLAVIDANPDAGSLAGRVSPQPPPATISDLLDHAGSITRAAEAWRYLIQHPSRLDVLAAPLDPAVTRQLGEAEYSRALEVLTRFYSIIYADLGTALLGPATSYFLRRRADQVILVSAPSLDAGRIAGFTLDHLVVARGADWCRRHVIVVVNAVRNDTLVDVRRLEEFFAPHVRATHRVAWDRHLAAGGTLQWDLLEHRTRDCYLELAALIADGFTEGRAALREGEHP